MNPSIAESTSGRTDTSSTSTTAVQSRQRSARATGLVRANSESSSIDEAARVVASVPYGPDPTFDSVYSRWAETC